MYVHDLMLDGFSANTLDMKEYVRFLKSDLELGELSSFSEI